MKRQTILWTVVPSGFSDDGLRLRASLVASPRLETDEAPYRLGQFPDWLDWPAKLAGATFALQFQGGPLAPATVVSAPSSAAWTALMDADTPLEPYVFEGLRDRAIHSYPVGHIADWIAAFYGQVYDLSPEGFPHPGRVEQPLDQLISERHRGVAAQLRSYLDNPELRAVPPGPPDTISDFAQAALFHAAPPAIIDPIAATDGADGPLRALAVDPPELDFHAAVSALGSYPALQRLFGIVIDVEVPAEGVPGGPGAAVAIAATMAFAPAVPTTTSSARTRYDLDAVARRFEAASKLPVPQVRDGLLNLSPGDGQVHRVVQTDTDGGALKLIQLADNLRRISQRQDAFLRDRVPDTGALPSVPDGGLAVIRTGRAFALARRLDDLSVLQAALVTDPNAPETLFREDLVQGYRLDVFDILRARWASLCARRGPWRILGDADAVLQSGELDDEGFVETGATSKPEGGSPDLYAHEALMRWAGWSLVAPRPGEAILPDDGVGDPDEQPDPEFRLRTDLAVVPGTLPLLRYGRQYRLRVRAVDLAGNGRPLGDPADADLTGASDPVPYWRHQPVPYPAVVPRALPNDALGEANETLVLRSAAGVLATDYAAAESLPPSDERHVLAPRATVELVERHGRLKSPAGVADPSPATYALLAARDQGLATVPGALAGGPGGEIVAIPGETFDLPYLPDPLARGACFRGLPGVAPGEAFAVLFPPGPGGTWADLRPIRLRIEEDLSGTLAAPQLPQWDPTTGILTAYLPKSLVARVWVSCILAPGDEDLFAVWQWFVKHRGGAVTEALRTDARLGKHWLLTPPRRLALVHAVPKPLEQPVLSGLAANRTTLGQTDAALVGAVAVHGHSTGKLDVGAAWEEPYDNPAAPMSTMRSGKAPVGELDVAPADTSLPLAGMRHRFGDTKHRLVDYSTVATTRFQEFFPAALTANLDDITLTSAALTADVPSSARPIAPDVRYVVPTFRWEDTPTSRTRKPGLRVYLGRPWFGSGEGELLAVLLEDRELPIALPGATPAPFEVSPALAPFATQWAVDPIWNAASPGNIGPARFPNRVATRDDLTLEEMRLPNGSYPTDNRVTAVGFPVVFDADRRLWFADIDVDAEGGYWPFIRLALARFQPSSIPNAHLSRVVLADFAQISPERVASITDLTGNRYRVAISGAVAATASDIQPPKREYAARIEQRPIAEPDEGEVATWTPVGSVELIQQREGYAGEFVTRGDASMRYRLVIEEREQFPFTELQNREDPVPERTVYLGILDVPFVPLPTATPSATASPTGVPPAAATATPTWTPAPSRTPAPTETASPGPTATITPTDPPTRTASPVTPGTPGTPGEETATPGTPGTPPATATDDGEEGGTIYAPYTHKP